jgi:hypothetical protein
MAANRALVTIGNGMGVTITMGTSGAYLAIQYIIFDSDDNVVGSIQGLQLTLGYSTMNNMVNAIRNAVQTNEVDSSLQVYVI